MASTSFDVTRDYDVIQDLTGIQYLLQDGNWYLRTTQQGIAIAPNGWKRLPKGVSGTYPGIAPLILAQGGLPMYLPPSGFFANNGVLVIGQAPALSATASFSATSGAGVTMTFSAATLLGTAADVGRVLTILDTTYKYAVITAQSSTTVATVTLTGTLSGLGPFANASIWLSGSPPATANTSAFSVPFDNAFANCYLYFPAGAIFSGSLAGLYFAQFQSTTVATVYNVTYTSGQPSIPTTLTAFATTGPGAFTQTTGSSIAMLTATVLAAAMGGMGKVKITCVYQNNNSANTKTFSIRYGASQTLGTTSTANQSTSIIREVYNRGTTNSQTSTSNGITGTGAAAGPSQVYAKDSGAAQDVTLQNQLATATDWVGIDSYTVEVSPAA